jgi:hypothetical protein
MGKPSDSDQLRETLRSLTLDCIADHLDALCDHAVQAAWSDATFFAQLLEEALRARAQRR